MDNGFFTLNLKNGLEELEPLKDAVERICGEFGLDRKAVFQVKLAVEEIFVNIVSYGFRDNAEHWIQVNFFEEDGMLVICFEDDGVYFNPLKLSDPDVRVPVEERRTGGLGIYLTKNLMNEIKYARCSGKNRLVMKKKIV